MTLVPDFDGFVAGVTRPDAMGGGSPSRATLFWRAKTCFDMVGAMLMLPFVAMLGVVLTVLNPVLNPGPLFFRQDRMGRHGVVFSVLKFRTMRQWPDRRGALESMEAERVPRLGYILRKTGLDELPQALNILLGEMSLIGPRPDCVRHARIFLETIPEYRHRLCVKPGMSGLAQVTLGYAVGLEATRKKARVDLRYIAHANPALELWIIWRTVLTVLLARGD